MSDKIDHRSDREGAHIERPVEMEMVAGLARADIARPFKALLKEQGTTIRFAIHLAMSMIYAQAGKPLPPALASELAQFGPKGRVPRMRHVPGRMRD